MISKKFELWLAAAAAAIPFAVYLLTLAPTVTFVDNGELAAVPYLLGIPHPTSYPLFTLTHAVLARLPLGLRPITHMNLMAAVGCAAALFFFFRFLLFLLTTATAGRDAGARPATTADRIFTVLPAFMGTLLLGFSEIFWSTALSIEVYPLHMVFVTLLLLVFARTINRAAEPGLRSSDRLRLEMHWLGFAYLVGLSFTNHMTTVVLAPGFLYLYFATYGWNKPAWRRLLVMTPFFLVALTVYYFIILRAQAAPLINWGDPHNFERFTWVFTGKMYRRFMFSSLDVAGMQWEAFRSGLPAAFGYAAIVPAVLGLVKLFRDAQRWFIGTLLLFLASLFYALNYEIPDIEPYFLVSHIVFAVWAAAGFQFLLQLPRARTIRMGAAAAIVGLGLLPLGTNYQRVDQSGTICVEEYVENVQRSLEPNAILLTGQYDTFYPPMLYFQLMEKKRSDVVPLSKNLLQRAWYYDQLTRQFGPSLRLPEPEIAAYHADMDRVDRDLPYDTMAVNRRIMQIIWKTLSLNYSSRPLYVTSEVEDAYTAGYRRIPQGLVFRLLREDQPRYFPMPEFSITLPRYRNESVNKLIAAYASAYANNAIYAKYMGMENEASRLIDRCLEIWPDSEEGLMVKKRLEEQW